MIIDKILILFLVDQLYCYDEMVSENQLNMMLFLSVHYKTIFDLLDQ